MTLKLKFDDMMYVVTQLHETNIESEKEIVNLALNLKAQQGKCVEQKQERQRLEKILAKEAENYATIKTQLQVERMKLEEERQKISTLERERDALENILSEARKVVMGHNSSSILFKSLLESMSIRSDE